MRISLRLQTKRREKKKTHLILIFSLIFFASRIIQNNRKQNSIQLSQPAVSVCNRVRSLDGKNFIMLFNLKHFSASKQWHLNSKWSMERGIEVGAIPWSEKSIGEAVIERFWQTNPKTVYGCSIRWQWAAQFWNIEVQVTLETYFFVSTVLN